MQLCHAHKPKYSITFRTQYFNTLLSLSLYYPSPCTPLYLSSSTSLLFKFLAIMPSDCDSPFPLTCCQCAICYSSSTGPSVALPLCNFSVSLLVYSHGQRQHSIKKFQTFHIIRWLQVLTIAIFFNFRISCLA